MSSNTKAASSSLLCPVKAVGAEWWVSDYASSIYEYMVKREREGRYAWEGHSPHLSSRQPLVSWMCAVGRNQHLSPPVRHLAVYILDIFMDNHLIQQDHMQLVALVCLLIAAKLEEKDILIPKTSELNAHAAHTYRLKDFLQVELQILDFFSWDILVPTPAHFAEYLVHHALTPHDIFQQRQDKAWSLSSSLNHYVYYFLDITLQDTAYLKMSPSMVGAACVAASRSALFLSPYWTTNLEKVSHYCAHQLAHCLALLLKAKNEEEKVLWEASSTFPASESEEEDHNSSPHSSSSLDRSC